MEPGDFEAVLKARVFTCNPKVGEVFEKKGGPKGYMIIVSDNGSQVHYVAVDPEGRITGVGRATGYYFSRRRKVGLCTFMPSVRIKWERR